MGRGSSPSKATLQKRASQIAIAKTANATATDRILGEAFQRANEGDRIAQINKDLKYRTQVRSNGDFVAGYTDKGEFVSVVTVTGKGGQFTISYTDSSGNRRSQTAASESSARSVAKTLAEQALDREKRRRVRN